MITTSQSDLNICFFFLTEAGSGQIAGIASAIGVALLGAASSYFAYQKKKLCFKLQGGECVVTATIAFSKRIEIKCLLFV